MVPQSSVDWVIQNAKARLGNPYVYGGVYSPWNVNQGADCSGVVGWVLEALTKGPQAMSWSHNVSTESWHYDYRLNKGANPGAVGPYGTVAVANLSDIPSDAALTINIMHGGGGEDSHTNCIVPLPGSLPYEGVIVESNGDHGSCTNGSGAYASSASLWSDHWFLPGPWVFDVAPGTSVPAVPHIGSGKSSYIVQPGDSLSAIADRFGVLLSDLISLNRNIANPDYIYVGEVISLP